MGFSRSLAAVCFAFSIIAVGAPLPGDGGDAPTAPESFTTADTTPEETALDETASAPETPTPEATPLPDETSIPYPAATPETAAALGEEEAEPAQPTGSAQSAVTPGKVDPPKGKPQIVRVPYSLEWCTESCENIPLVIPNADLRLLGHAEFEIREAARKNIVAALIPTLQQDPVQTFCLFTRLKAYLDELAGRLPAQDDPEIRYQLRLISAEVAVPIESDGEKFSGLGNLSIKRVWNFWGPNLRTVEDVLPCEMKRVYEAAGCRISRITCRHLPERYTTELPLQLLPQEFECTAETDNCQACDITFLPGRNDPWCYCDDDFYSPVEFNSFSPTRGAAKFLVCQLDGSVEPKAPPGGAQAPFDPDSAAAAASPEPSAAPAETAAPEGPAAAV